MRRFRRLGFLYVGCMPAISVTICQLEKPLRLRGLVGSVKPKPASGIPFHVATSVFVDTVENFT